MRNIPFILALCLTIAASSSGMADASRAGIEEVSGIKPTVRQYELCETSISISVPYTNPYSYEEADLTADIILPDGAHINVPGFYSGRESIWKVRYTPTKTGRYSYRITLRSRSEIYSSEMKEFEVVAGEGDGFLRKGANNSFYPVFDSGRSFFGLGHNIAWATNNNLATFEKYFIKMNENGCNLTRIWLNCPWTFSIENERIGAYNVRDCEKLDSLLELAQRYGIYIILTLDSYSALMEEEGPWKEQFWKNNPYNKVNGGPCEKPQDFFTDEMAKKYYKNRLRYIIARFSHSPNIMAFELWNEFDAPPEWTQSTARYIKTINPHGQFITTSLGYPWGNTFSESSVWGLDGIDIIDRHIYANMARGVIASLISVNRELARSYNKCILIGEFGMDSGKNDAASDAAGGGAALHTSLWATIFTKSFACPLNWWWYEYVFEKNLYHHYRAVRNFVNDIDWNSKTVEFLNVGPVMNTLKGPPSYSDASVNTSNVWGETTYKTFRIDNNGDMEGGAVNAYLHGTTKDDMRIEPVFHVNFPADGKFIVRIHAVSQDANLVIYIDDKEALTRKLPAGPGEGPWKRSLYRKEYDIYQCVYDTAIEVKVPRGEHIIKLSNTGKDWIEIKGFTLTNYISSLFANARVVGLKVGKDLILWIQNKEYDWQNDIKLIIPQPIKGATFKIPDVEKGDYIVEWWDTFKGEAVSKENVSAKDGELNISVPEFSKDLACKIRKGE